MTAAPTPIPAETEGQAPILLSTSDPVFAMVLTAALAPEIKPISVPVDGVLDAARNAPDSMLLLDLDDMEISAAVRLVTKLTLVTRRPILLTGTRAVEGDLALEPLLLCGAAGLLQKPQGRSSVGLCASGGSSYVERLRQAAAAIPSSHPA